MQIYSSFVAYFGENIIGYIGLLLWHLLAVNNLTLMKGTFLNSFLLPEILFLTSPIRFLTSISKLQFSIISTRLMTNTGWGNVFDVPLYSAALTFIGSNVSEPFSIMRHCTKCGTGTDFIFIVNHRRPSSFLSYFPKNTSGTPSNVNIFFYKAKPKMKCDHIIQNKLNGLIWLSLNGCSCSILIYWVFFKRIKLFFLAYNRNIKIS